MTQNLINASLVPFGVPVVDPSGQELSALTMADGQLIIGATSSPLAAALLLAGASITLTPGAGTVTIAATGGGGATISGIVGTVIWGDGLNPVPKVGTHTFHPDMVCAEITFFGSGGGSPATQVNLTGSGAPYPIETFVANGGGDSGAYLRLFGTAAQLGASFDYEIGAFGATFIPHTEEWTDPIYIASLSPPPDQTAYPNLKGGDSTLDFASGVTAVIPGGDGSRTSVGAATSDTTALPIIVAEGMVASKRWGNPVLPTCSDLSLVICAGSSGPGYPGIVINAGMGASDNRAMVGGRGGWAGPQVGPGGSGTITTSNSVQMNSLLANGLGAGGGCRADGLASGGAGVGNPGLIIIIEYIS